MSPFLEVMSFSYEDLQSLSVTELKEILHKRQIDCAGIFNRDTLIEMVLGNHTSRVLYPPLPYSYTQLFEVSISMNIDLYIGFFIRSVNTPLSSSKDDGL